MPVKKPKRIAWNWKQQAALNKIVRIIVQHLEKFPPEEQAKMRKRASRRFRARREKK